MSDVLPEQSTGPVLWSPSSERLPACGTAHIGLRGRLDESARRLDHPELAVATRLVADGHEVVTLAERGRRGPVPDFLVCGEPVEVKSLLTMAERGDGRRATAATVHNRLASAVNQAGIVVLATEGSGCRAADAAAGLRSFAATMRTGRVAAVRILGDGFDLSWKAPPDLQAAVGAGRPDLPPVGPRDRAARRAGPEAGSSPPVSTPPRAARRPIERALDGDAMRFPGGGDRLPGR